MGEAKRPATMCEPSERQPLVLVENVRPRQRAETPPDGSLDPTKSVVGRYVVSRTLGEGGMGVVYQAVDVERCERVALKTLTGVTATSLWRFKREFRALADIVHPNLVQLYELYSHEEKLYLAMEFIDGVEFHDYIWVDHRPHHERLRDALRQLTLGVRALHDAGKLHLDIKPTNVMVTREGRVVLLDFGLIEDVPSELTYAAKHRAPSGTPSYMAPEQIEPKAPGQAADCYAIGVLLYEALTGLLPFDARELVELLQIKREAELVPPSKRVAEVPADLDDLAVRLLDRDPATRATLADILAVVDPEGTTTAGSPERPSDGPRLQGRDAQLQTLSEAFERACSGRPVTVYVEGESGIGKTALVRSFLRRAKTAADAVVLETRCYQRDSLPLKTLDGLVDSLTSYLRSLPTSNADALLPRHIGALARLFPVLERVKAIRKFPRRDDEEADPRGLRARAFAALRELLVRMSDRRPLAIFVDDLQWGDVESGWLFQELLEGPEAPAVLFIGGFRSGETHTSPLLRELSSPPDSTHGQRDTVEIRLGQLRPADSRRLARRILAEQGTVDEELVGAIADEADGSPLFIEELARYHRDRAESTASSTPGVAPSFEEVVLSRVHRLDSATQRMLRVIAIAGRPVPVAIAVEAAKHGTSVGSSEGTLRVLVSENLAREMGNSEGRQVECFHGRIRDVILESLDKSTVERVHARLAAALSSTGGQPERLTLHLLGAGRLREAGEAALLAAAHAEQALAFERAAALYSVALRNMTMTEDRRRDLETRRATALAGAGKISSAAGLYLRNSSRGQAARMTTKGGTKRNQALTRRRLAAQKLLQTGHIEEGIAILGSVMAPLDLALPDSEMRARLRWWKHRVWLSLRARRNIDVATTSDATELLRCDACGTAAAGLGITDGLNGAELAARHLVLAIQTGDPARMVEAASFYASRLAAWGRCEDSRKWFDWAEETGQGSYDLRMEGRTGVMRGLASLEQGQWQEAVRQLSDAQDSLSRSYREHAWETALIRSQRIAALAELGEFRQVVRELPLIVEAGRKSEDHLTVMLTGARCGHLVGLAQDDLARAKLLVDTAAEQMPRGSISEPQVWILAARLQMAQYANEWGEASRLLDRHWPTMRHAWVGKHPGLRATLERMRALTALGLACRGQDPQANLAVARKAARSLAQSGRAVDRAHAEAILAEVAAQIDGPQAAEQMAEAAEAFERLGMRLWAAALAYRAADLSPTDDGRARQRKALADTAEQGIHEPLRFLSIYAPGLQPTDRGANGST
jgi:hypothetical protein